MTASITWMSTGASVLQLPDRLDVHALGRVRSELNALLESHPPRVLIAAGEVRHADGAGLAFLRGLRQDLEAAEVAFEVQGMSLTLRISLELNDLRSELEAFEARLVDIGGEVAA